LDRTIRARGTRVHGSWRQERNNKRQKDNKRTIEEQGKLYTDPQGRSIESRGLVSKIGVGRKLDLGSQGFDLRARLARSSEGYGT